MAVIKMIRDNNCWWGSGGKGTLPHCWWECKLVQPLWKTLWSFLKKLKLELTYDPAISLLGIYVKEMKLLSQRSICTPVFLVALFIIVKMWKQPMCPLMNKWIKKTYVYMHIYLQNIIQPQKRNKFCHLWQHGWILRALC